MNRQAVVLENDHISLEMVPAFGARVTRLIDRRSGRDWLVGGQCQGDPGNESIYSATEARGWDECFPTVAGGYSSAWQRNLRDHGELWGREWHCALADNTLTAEYRGSEFAFRRSLVLDDAGLVCDYEVENLGAADLPYIWSQHCLLSTKPGERIVLDGVSELAEQDGPYGWPVGPDGRDHREIRAIDAAYAHKGYARVIGQASVGIDGPDGGIRFSWNAGDAGYVGVWRDYGGWPEEGPVHQVAFEPTTAPAHGLASATAQDNQSRLPPGHKHTWRTRIYFVQPAPV
ncbi:MAG: hypothetical protein GXP01_00205 [Alphaproteobacteria bacterium]|nr:hypothetical protein [Alphaproteobacteria bacterium]